MQNNDPKKNALRRLAEQLKVKPDATAVDNNPPQLPIRSIGPVTEGNTPLPEATVQSQHQPKYDKAMNILADMLPIIGSVRGIKAGHDMAQQGSPLAGAGMAMASLLPDAAIVAKESDMALAKALRSFAEARGNKIDPLQKAEIYRLRAAADLDDAYKTAYGKGYRGDTTVAKGLSKSIARPDPRLERKDLFDRMSKNVDKIVESTKAKNKPSIADRVINPDHNVIPAVRANDGTIYKGRDTEHGDLIYNGEMQDGAEFTKPDPDVRGWMVDGKFYSVRDVDKYSIEGVHYTKANTSLKSLAEKRNDKTPLKELPEYQDSRDLPKWSPPKK